MIERGVKCRIIRNGVLSDYLLMVRGKAGPGMIQRTA